jgi:hypothetical protein
LEYLVIVLRLVHIVSAFVWFAVGLSGLMIGMASVHAGESGLRFNKALYTRTIYATLPAIAAVVTTLAGLALYASGSAARFTNFGNAVLGTGALAGLLAFGHGAMATGRYSGLYGKALQQYVPDNGSIAPEGAAELRNTGSKVALHGRISFILMVIALLGMSLARYMPSFGS